jgi:hypothetical protein
MSCSCACVVVVLFFVGLTFCVDFLRLTRRFATVRDGSRWFATVRDSSRRFAIVRDSSRRFAGVWYVPCGSGGRRETNHTTTRDKHHTKSPTTSERPARPSDERRLHVYCRMLTAWQASLPILPHTTAVLIEIGNGT